MLIIYSDIRHRMDSEILIAIESGEIFHIEMVSVLLNKFTIK